MAHTFSLHTCAYTKSKDKDLLDGSQKNITTTVSLFCPVENGHQVMYCKIEMCLSLTEWEAERVIFKHTHIQIHIHANQKYILCKPSDSLPRVSVWLRLEKQLI